MPLGRTRPRRSARDTLTSACQGLFDLETWPLGVKDTPNNIFEDMAHRASLWDHLSPTCMTSLHSSLVLLTSPLTGLIPDAAVAIALVGLGAIPSSVSTLDSTSTNVATDSKKKKNGIRGDSLYSLNKDVVEQRRPKVL